MRLLTKQERLDLKGCKTRFCKKKKSCSSSSSSGCSNSNESFKKIKACRSKFLTISGTTLSSVTCNVTNKLTVTNDIKNNIPTLVTGVTNVTLPTNYSDLSLIYILTVDAAGTSINFPKFNSKFNGVRLIFANATGVTLTNAGSFTVTSTDSISTGGGTIPVGLINGNSVEYVGQWNSSTSSMVFYKVR